MKHRLRPEAGFTLLEIMVTLAIVAGLLAGATIGIRTVSKTDLRAAASKLGSALRYLHDRARSTSKNYRLVIDFESASYWAEETDDRFYLSKEPQRELDAEAKPAEGAGGAGEKPSEEETDAADARALAEPWKPRRARYASFKDAHLKVEKLKGARFTGVTTAIRGETQTEGRAYIHFFPQGLGERAVLELTDRGGAVYSIVNHPLTGRVKIVADHVDPRLALDLQEEAR